MKKMTFYTEAAYGAGILLLAFATALMERADFGMSMVVAPAYVLHLKISQVFPWFSFGMVEYCFQALLLLLLALAVQRVHLSFLFSFVTAVIYGSALDAMMTLVGVFPMPGIGGRVLFFVLGMVLCSAGVALLFHTYLAPEAYELFVKELSRRLSKEIPAVKTVYDCVSCFLAVGMSFVFFGFLHFEGVKAGTVICALVNGWMIGQFGKLFERKLDFSDALGLRKYFE